MMVFDIWTFGVILSVAVGVFAAGRYAGLGHGRAEHCRGHHARIDARLERLELFLVERFPSYPKVDE